MVKVTTVPIPPTKEMWIPTTIGLATAAAAKLGDHGGYLVDASNEEAITEFHVPHDFHAIEEALLVIIPKDTLTPMTFTIYIDYCANGETYNVHTGVASQTQDTVSQKLLELNIAAGLAAISPGDYVGVRFECDLGANTNAIVLGVKLKYK